MAGMQLRQLSQDAVDYVIDHGEFDSSVTSAARHVAIVLTQGWCPQWVAMRHYLEKADDNVTVFYLVYDKNPRFHDFLRVKEEQFGNSLIPYVRYYIDGALVGRSNFVGKGDFLGRFRAD